MNVTVLIFGENFMKHDLKTFTIHHVAYKVFLILTIGMFACFGFLCIMFEQVVFWDFFAVVWEILFLILSTVLVAKTPKGLDEYVSRHIPIAKIRFFRFIPFIFYGVVFCTFLSAEFVIKMIGNENMGRVLYFLIVSVSLYIFVYLWFFCFSSPPGKKQLFHFSYVGMIFSLLRVRRWAHTSNSPPVWSDFVMDFFLPLYIAIGCFMFSCLLNVLRSNKK